jgi:hypothetical protein
MTVWCGLVSQFKWFDTDRCRNMCASRKRVDTAPAGEEGLTVPAQRLAGAAGAHAAPGAFHRSHCAPPQWVADALPTGCMPTDGAPLPPAGSMRGATARNAHSRSTSRSTCTNH